MHKNHMHYDKMFLKQVLLCFIQQIYNVVVGEI